MSQDATEAPVEAPVEAPPGPPRVRRPLWVKLAVGASLLAIVPVVVVGLLLIDINEDALKGAIQEIHLGVAEDVTENIERTFVEVYDGLDGVARSLSSKELDPEGRLALAKVVVESSEAVDHAVVYDKAGAPIDTIAERGVAVPEPTQLPEVLRGQARADGGATGEVKAVMGGVRVQTLVPIEVGDEVTGYVGTWADLSPVQRRVEFLAEHRFVEPDEALVVLDHDRRPLAHATRGRLEGREAVAHPLLDQMTPAMFEQGATYFGDYETSQGEAWLGVVKPMRHKPWVVVAQTPQDVAYASVHRMRVVVLASIVGAVLLSLLAALLFARRLTAPIEALVSYTAKLANRQFDADLEVDTQDELAVLAGAMTRAAADLEASEEALEAEVAIRTDLGRYLPRDLVEDVVRREHDMVLGGSRRQITVLFADVVAFTPLTEKLEAEEVVAMLNQLFTILTEIVFRHDGTVDKFIGDCVMAFWGAPRAQEDHAELALTAAEDMLRFLEVGNADWEQRYDVTIQLAIGVNTGEAIVGNVGSETRMEYTAIGDVVNVAARLEAVANPQQILITEATKAAAGDFFDYVPYGARDISGRVGDVTLYEVVL